MGPQKFEKITISGKDYKVSIQSLESSLPFWRINKLFQSFKLTGGLVVSENLSLIDIQGSNQNSQIEAQGMTSDGGHFKVEGTYLASDKFHLTSTLTQFPTPLIDRFFDLGGALNATLGRTVNSTSTFGFEGDKGSINLKLSSPFATSVLSGSIQDNHLTLIQPFKADLFVSEPLERLLTQSIGPNLIESFQPKNSFHLTIFPEGFSCPTNIKKLKSLKIKQAEINLGQIRVNPGIALQSTLNLFQTRSSFRNIELWLTPISFSYQNQVLKLNRLDALIGNSTHLCLWGDLNVKTNALNMTLGIPKNTLVRSFGLQTVAPGFVLKIPVRGTLEKPVIDSGPVIAKITAMKAAESIPSTGGKVLGGLINIFTQSTEDDDIPDPQYPFPWER